MSILFDNPPPAIGCGDPGVPIPFACLFDGGQALERLFGAGDTACWTYSAWVKITDIDTIGPSALSFLSVLPASGSISANGTFFSYMATRSPLGFYIRNAAISGGYNYMEVARTWRDPNAYAHVCLSHDASLPLADRYKLSFLGLRLPGVYNGGGGEFNRAVRHAIGGHIPFNGGAVNPSAKAYLADIHFVDGIALGPEDFGYFNSDGVWVPKKYDGLYGDNGFHLNFSDPLDLGKDVSGNGNHFTAVGLTADHQVKDTPSQNKSTWNPLHKWYFGASSPGWPAGTFSDGNTRFNSGTTSYSQANGSQLISEGRYYAELQVDYVNGSAAFGVANQIGEFAAWNIAAGFLDNDLETPSAPAASNGNRIGIFIDMDLRKVWFHRQGIWINGDPHAQAGGLALPGSRAVHLFITEGNGSVGQYITATLITDDFAYPSLRGKARRLSMDEYPCPDILNPDDYFTIRHPIGGADIDDLPWDPTVHKTLVVSKRLDADTSWRVSDTVSGNNVAWRTDVGGLQIASSLTFTPNGINVGADTEYQGSRIDHFWRASPKAGFDIVEIDHETGTDTTALHKVGGLIQYAWIVNLDDGGDAFVFHHRLPANKFLRLNATGLPVTKEGFLSFDAATVTIGASAPTGRYMLYPWRGVPQFSAFPEYDGTGSTDGAFIPTDFLPRLFTATVATDGGSTSIPIITADEGPNPVGSNGTFLETHDIGPNRDTDLVSNGAKLRHSATSVNANGETFMAALWAKTPGKFARAR